MTISGGNRRSLKTIRCWRCGTEEELDSRSGWGQIYLRDDRDRDRDWPAVDLCRSCVSAFKREFLGGWKCPAVLMLNGEAYRCDHTCVDRDGDPVIGHEGWAHSNRRAGAMW